MPSYVKATIDAVDYTCLESDSLDLNTVDGKSYYYNKVMSGGPHTYKFKTKDAYSPEIVTTEKNLQVNNIPALSNFGRTPADPVYVTTQLNFTCTFTDIDNDLPSSIKWREDGGTTQNLSMTQVDPDDSTTTDGKAYFVWVNLGHGEHNYDYFASDSLSWTSGGSNSISIVNRNPEIENGPGASVNEWRNTFWQCDFNGHDDDSDIITWGRAGYTWLSIDSGTGVLSGTTTNTPGDYAFTVYANDSYSGQATYGFTLHVLNRAPDITNGPGAHVDQWRNTWWDYDFNATDADTDSIGWEKSGASWLFINAASGLVSGTTSDTPGLYSFVIYANDSYGGSDSYAFDIHIENRAPSITNGPGAHVDEWRSTYWEYDFDASDGDNDVIDWGMAGVDWLTINEFGELTGLLYGETTDTPGEYEVTVYANDSYSGQDTYVFTIHILNRLPTITSAGNTTQLDGTYMAYLVTYTDGDSDTCTLGWSSNASWLAVDGWWINGTATGVGWYECTIWVNDTYDSDSDHWHVEVTSAGNQPPSFTTSPALSGDHPWDYYYDANADDPEFDPLTFGLEGNCTTYLSIVPSTGVVSGNIPVYGWLYMNVSVTDGTSIVWQNVTVNATNIAPTFDSSPTESWQHGTSYTYDANAHDDNGDGLTFGLDGNCTTFLNIIPGTGVVSGTPPTVGWWYVNVSVIDDNSWVTWQNYTLTGLNTAPSFTSSGITEWQNGTEYVYDANANDVNSDGLTFSLEGNCTVYFQINPTTGVVNGTILQMGWWYCNISVNDTWSITWQNFTVYALNTPPDITTSPGLTGAPGVEYSYDANASDLNGDTVEWATTEKPIWLVVDPVTGICTGIPVINGNYDVKLVAFDGLAYDWQNWTIVVSDVPPPPPVTPPSGASTGGPLGCPYARFSYTINGMSIIVQDESYISEGQAIVRIQWDFGDGFGSQESKTSHRYANPGNYTLRLTVWTPYASSSITVFVEVRDTSSWSIYKGEAGWEIKTPAGKFAWHPALSLVLGIGMLLVSTRAKRFPIVGGKGLKIMGIAFLIAGVSWFIM